MMGKTSGAATVIDLDAFRQRRMQQQAERESASDAGRAQAAAMFVPVWYCWVPVWAPVMP